MHIYLTGEVQIGKSTVIARALSGLSVHIGGFQTFWSRRGTPDKTLHMRGISDVREGDKRSVVARFSDQGPIPFPDAFDAIGCALLANARATADIIVMDECGKLERDALLFQAEVLKTLDGDTPVLGVVRQDAGGWTERIVGHPRVIVMTVTEENRDALPDVLRARFV